MPPRIGTMPGKDVGQQGRQLVGMVVMDVG